MYKRILCCAAALMLAAGGLTALPQGDITAYAYKVDETKIKTWGDFKYVVWDDEYEGDTELTDNIDYNTYDAVEIVDYKITGDTIEFPDEIDGRKVRFIDSEKLKAANVKKVKLPKYFYYFYDHSGWESNSYSEDREKLPEVLGCIETLEYVDIHTDDYASRDGIVYTNDYMDEYTDYEGKSLYTLIFVPPMVSSYTFPKDIKYVGYKAFYGNTEIKTLNVPSTIEDISVAAFMCCYGVKKITIASAPVSSHLQDEAFRSCSSLESVTLPSSGIETIGDCCFQDCHSLKSITLPQDVRYINGFAFSGCTALEKVDLGKKLLRIYDGAFSDLFNLKSLTIPESIQSIYEGSVGMAYSAEEHMYVPIEGFKLYCYPGVGEEYAKASGLDYELLAAPMKDTKIKLTKGSKYAYNGKVIKPAVKVTYKGKTLKKGTDYKVIYQNLTTPGKRKLTVKGIGKFSGKVKKTFYVVPAATKAKKLTSPKKKAVKLTWKRDKVSDGYQIFVSYNKNFKKKAKTVVIKKNKTTAKTITGLKSKKRCYVKLRAYKLIDGKKYYGKCSKTLSVVCK